MPPPTLATLDALLNATSALFLLVGYLQIRRGRRISHPRWMLAALASSCLFLLCYLVYHYQVGSVPYPYHDWTRPVYFAILIPHVLLAALVLPFIGVLLWRAARQDFSRHRRLARWVWPAWMWVSLSGVAVYLMLYRP